MWKVITLPKLKMQKVITFRIFDAGSKTEFTNNSLKTPKIGKLNIDTLVTPQGLMIHEKTQTKKSHATVPLTALSLLKNSIINLKRINCIEQLPFLKNLLYHYSDVHPSTLLI